MQTKALFNFVVTAQLFCTFVLTCNKLVVVFFRFFFFFWGGGGGGSAVAQWLEKKNISHLMRIKLILFV